MEYKEYNNNYFSWQGVINRKNYIINMFMLIAIFILTSLVPFQNFERYINFKFIYSTLIFSVNFFKFIIIMSALSVIYRRIADFSSGKSYKFKMNMIRIFAVFYVFPLLYFYCIRYFLNFYILDIFSLALGGFGFISALIFCFIKGD